MKSSLKKAVTTGAVVAALALGGSGVAFATTGAASAPANDTSSTSDTQDQEQTFVGTIPAPAEASDGDGETADDATETPGTETNDDAAETPGTETNDDAAEGAESAALEKLATVTSDEATAAALKAVPGTAGEVELENENGYVVYGVEITATDGTVTDVKVDAGDASVLAHEADGAEGQDEN